MTTTTATTTSTAASTAAATITGSSIATTLGIGSGIDTTALVTQLAAANKAPQEKLITTRETANAAQVSSLATISSSIDSFASALKTLVGGGSLFTQPTSSLPAIGVAAVAGSRLASGLSASLQVNRLAAGQTVVSKGVADPSAAIGKGTVTLKTAAGSFPLAIGEGNDSLAGLAAAINGANAGVTASVVDDGTASHLVVKGATGAANAFSLTPAADADAGLSAYAYDPAAGTNAMTAASTAQDAQLTLDGVAVTRPGNTISDLLPGVKLTLTATTATPATIGASVPTDAIAQAVQDFVSAYNEVQGTLATATASGASGGTAGPFGSNGTIRGVVTQMARLTSTPLVAAGPVRTLADLGVSTQQDGTLAVNPTKLAKAIAANPDATAALFNPTQSSSDPAVSIKSPMGATPPGTYQLTDLVAGPPPSGKVNGVAMQAVGQLLVASADSGAAGLVVGVGGSAASATLTVEPGLGGALQSIRDGLRSATGPLQNLSNSLSAQAKQIATDRTAMETRASAYQDRLSASFTTMNSRVSALKATQSYLEQQIKVWTNGSNS